MLIQSRKHFNIRRFHPELTQIGNAETASAIDVPIRTIQETKEQIDPSDTIPSGPQIRTTLAADRRMWLEGGKGRNGGGEGNLRAPSLLRRRLKNPSCRLILEITSSNPSAATNDSPNIESADTNNMSSELDRGHEEQQSGTAIRNSKRDDKCRGNTTIRTGRNYFSDILNGPTTSNKPDKSN